MPTYSYRCPACGRQYDRLQKMSDTTRAKCPDCGTPGERQISAGIGFIFKGSGFYETDYKRAGETHAKSETADSDTGSERPAKSDSSKAKKPETTDKPKTGDKS